MQRVLSRQPLWLKQAAKFLTVGVVNTALDALIYFLLTRLVPYFATQHVLAKAISYSCGILNSFFWNRLWTFRSRARVSGASTGGAMVLYAGANLSGLALNTAVMQLGLHNLGLPELIAFVLATALTTGWNFLTSKFLVFRERSGT